MAGVSTVLQGRWQWSIKIKWPNSRCKFRVLEEGYLRAQQNKRTNSNAWRPWKSTNGKRNQMLTFYFSIVLKILIGGSAKTAVAETRGTVDHRMQCSTLERVLHYWGLAIDQILFVEVSKIPWSGVRSRGWCRRPSVSVRIRLSLGRIRRIS